MISPKVFRLLMIMFVPLNGQGRCPHRKAKCFFAVNSCFVMPYSKWLSRMHSNLVPFLFVLQEKNLNPQEAHNLFRLSILLYSIHSKLAKVKRRL